jgi:hypothetical protein
MSAPGESASASSRVPAGSPASRIPIPAIPAPSAAASAPKWVNIPRALFLSRTGRQPLYHLNIGELQDWIYSGAKLSPLKGYPGVVWERPKRKKHREPPAMF